jgi:tetratricopeptide (TPR) repeat protein
MHMKLKLTVASAWIACAFAVASGPALPAFDADPLEGLAMSNPEFMKGRAAIEARDWNSAIQSLTAADKRTPNNADINNLLGFAYRSAGQIEPAIDHYRRALKIDPRHRGAHEYIGEAYLRAGNPAKAEEHLVALKRACPIVCQERDDLGRKIAAYKAGSR